MEFSELIEKRRSIRRYAGTAVKAEDMEKILHAAFSAPSAGNFQAYKIYVVRDPAIREKLCEAAHGQDKMRHAPVSLVFCADRKQNAQKYGERGADFYSIQDATIAAAYAQLEIANLGLGAVWVGGFDTEKAADAIGAQEGEIQVAILPIGHPAEDGRPRERRARDEIVREK